MKLYLWLLFLLLLPSVTALTDNPSLDLTAPAGAPYDIKIPCSSGGWFCNPATICNLTITFPNSSYLVDSQQMSVVKSDANLTLTAAQTEFAGQYGLDTKCMDPTTGFNATYTDILYITPTGDRVTGVQGSLYIIIFIFALMLTIGFFVAGIFIPGNNKTDQMTGYIIAVSNLKYVKILAYAFSYIMLVVMIYFAWQIAYAYLTLTVLSKILQFLFYFLAYATLPLFIVCLYLIVANLIRDSNVSASLERGLRISE